MLKYLNFRGESFTYDDDAKTLSFHVREPFYSAGKQFGWKGATIGLGINQHALRFAVDHFLTIRVTVENRKKAYEIPAVEWLRFAQKHNSVMMKGNTEIFVVQWAKDTFVTKEITN